MGIFVFRQLITILQSIPILLVTKTMYIITMFANNNQEEKLNKCFWRKDDPPLLLIVHIYNTFLKSTITKLPRSRAFMNFQDTFSKWNAHKDGNTNEETNNAQTKHECCFDLQPSMFTNYTHSTKKKRSVC
jgi:hypothetical protein